MTTLIITVVTAVNAAFMTLISSLTFVFQSYRWWYPENSSVPLERLPARRAARGLLLVAARHEEAVLRAALERLAVLDFSDYLVAVIIDHPDDPATLEVARRAQRRHPGRFHIVRYPEDTDVHNKPIGLNAALRDLERLGHHDWSWVGVVDAEDLLHVDLLRLVDDRFRISGAAVVQAGVQLMNFSSWHRDLPMPASRVLGPRAARRPHGVVRSALDTGARVEARLRRWSQGNLSAWWRSANCLEYYKWFRSRLSVQAKIGVIPLGGNTVFFRREFVEVVRAQDRARGGAGAFWDESCLTEDCKIGMLASAMGYTVDVVYVPEMVTREETPQNLAKFVRQRVRWMQGFIQVFSEGVWRELPTVGQRLMALYILGFQFFQAYAGVVAPTVLVCGLFFKVPVVLVLVSTIPFGLGVLSVLIDLVMLREFGRMFAQRVRLRDYAGLVYGAIFFQLTLATAGVCAIVRHLRGRTNWVKTAHSGAHLGGPEVAAGGAAS